MFVATRNDPDILTVLEPSQNASSIGANLLIFDILNLPQAYFNGSRLSIRSSFELFLRFSLLRSTSPRTILRPSKSDAGHVPNTADTSFRSSLRG